MYFKKLPVKILMIFTTLMLFDAIRPTHAFAREACVSPKDWQRLKAGKWVSFKEKIGNKTFYGKVRYYPNGRRKVVMRSGVVHNGGSWKKVGDSIRVYSPERPGKTRISYRIKKKL